MKKMTYKIKSKKQGRPRADYKVRNVHGITPKGFKFHKIEGEEIIYEREKKHEK